MLPIIHIHILSLMSIYIETFIFCYYFLLKFTRSPLSIHTIRFAKTNFITLFESYLDDVHIYYVHMINTIEGSSTLADFLLYI